MAVTLETLVEPGVLRRIWQRIRDAERNAHLTQAPLVKDSTGGVAFQLTLSPSLQFLKARVLAGTYRPHAPLVVEAAKSKLLHRRLSFLSPEDALLLGALVKALGPSLVKHMPSWVSFGQNHAQHDASQESQDPYEGWWPKWLRFRRLVSLIEDDQNPLLVVSDITNFFGSVDQALLEGRINGLAALDLAAHDLLFFLLDRFRPVELYEPRGPMGLPVVSDDSSRSLAHYYLEDLDKEFLAEGRANRYTRWVDDMVISVPTYDEGIGIVGRIERTLSRIGLVANSSKTAIITKDEFRAEHLEDENEKLDLVHERVELGGPLFPLERRDFEVNLKGFLSSEQKGQWGRILRRYYTESRRTQSRTLTEKWAAHVREFPTNTKQIFDYLCYIASDDFVFVEQLFGMLKEHGRLFEDIQILAYETLLNRPFANDSIVRSIVVRECYQHYLGTHGYVQPHGYVRGLQALALFKFGGTKALDLLARRFPDDAIASPTFATYAFPVLAAANTHWASALAGIGQVEDTRILRIRALVDKIIEGDNAATKTMLGLLQPKITKWPTRGVVNPRVLPLIAIAQASTNSQSRQRVRNAMTSASAKVQNSGPPHLIDWITIDHLR